MTAIPSLHPHARSASTTSASRPADPALRAAASLLRRGLRPAAATALAALLAPAPCPADQGFAVQGGRLGSVRSVGVQWTLPVWYRADWEHWRLAGHPELQLNLHRRRSEELVQAGAFATFRLSPARRDAYPYVEAGVGLNMVSRDRLGPKKLSTRFQFGELLGIGYAWGGRSDGGGETSVGLRYTHYSNGGLKKPNGGLDAVQLVVSHRF